MPGVDCRESMRHDNQFRSDGARRRDGIDCHASSTPDNRLPVVALLARVSLLATLAFTFPPAISGTAPFVLDGNRMYAQIDFLRPDGSAHRALAYVDMGGTSVVIADTLFKELQIDSTRPMRFKVGALAVQIPAAAIVSVHRPPRSLAGSDLRVAAILPASVLEPYEVVMDYGQRTLTLAHPGTITPRGVAVPFQLDTATGLIAVNASIDGHAYAITIDNGSAYTWVRQRTANDWLGAHPTWARGTGAVGASNMMMLGDSMETAGTLMRIPEISVAALTLRDVGVLAAGGGRALTGGLEFFDWYSKKNAVPVIGWIGGNVLKGFQITVDYPRRTMYWLRQADPDTTDQDQIGLTLRAQGGSYFVAAIATKNGVPSVSGVEIGDRLIKIGDLEATNTSFGAIYGAMHGRAGETRVLLLERNGTQITVTARVTGF